MAITQSTFLPLKQGRFKVAYHKSDVGDCVSLSYGDVQTGIPLVRLHSSCLFGEAFHALDCDCHDQLAAAIQKISQHDGVILYRYAEGRGLGLENKIRSMEIERTRKLDTVDAFARQGYTHDPRSFRAQIEAMEDLGVSHTVKLLSGNPLKIDALRQAGYEVVDLVATQVALNPYNRPELLVKKRKMNHLIEGL